MYINIWHFDLTNHLHADPCGTAALLLAITLMGVALPTLWSSLTMQQDCLDPDHAFIIRNRDSEVRKLHITEVSLMRRTFHYKKNTLQILN